MKEFESKQSQEIISPAVLIELLSPNGLDNALQNENLRDVYKEAFGDWPYFEKYSDQEVDQAFEKIREKGLTFIAKDNNKIVGFEASLPLTDYNPNLLEGLNIDRNRAWFIQELGVCKKYRSFGIARRLLNENIAIFDKNIPFILQTHEENIPAISLYRSYGFEILSGYSSHVVTPGIQQEIIEYNAVFLIKN